MSRRGYWLSEDASRRLEGIVERIEEKASVAIDPSELEGVHERLNVREVLADLPEGFSEDDFVGVVKLAMLTECATDSYAAVFYEGARDYNAPWLGRFTERTWVPDEYTHTAPFKSMLLSVGFEEAELDREIRQVLDKTYVHSCGKTPVELTTFGILQEFLTDHWHGLIAKMLKNRAPHAASLATRVKRRETLHYIWYKEMTAAQIEENPELLHLVAATGASFNMPGVSLTPEYQLRALEWMPTMGANLDRNSREIVRHLFDIAGNTQRAGEMLLEVAALRGMTLGKVSAERAKAVLDRLGGRGYTLLGEAVLECVGLPIPAEIQARADARLAGGVPTIGALQERLRGMLRTSIARRIDLSSLSKA
ncbi:MAG: acyl-ACP desaturase [Dehalococcoidia bacterium]|nr:acyl-ACP desaturase [Dehalococcoidia bacterium]